MHCMKCGKEIPDQQVFCDTCLEAMDRHPVKPGTAINILSRPAPKAPLPILEDTPEAQISRLKKTIHSLQAALIAVLLLFVLCSGYLVYRHMQPEVTAPEIGRNYSATLTPNKAP